MSWSRKIRIVRHDAWWPASRCFVRPSELRCPAIVQMHAATTSCAARVIGVKRLLPGDEAIVVIDTDEAIVTNYLQPFLFRRPYPVGSFAGGRILASVDPSERTTATLLELGRAIDGSDPVSRLAAWVDFRHELILDPTWVESQLAVPSEDTDDLIKQCVDAGRATLIEGRLVSKATIDRVSKYVCKVLAQHAESGDDAWLDEEAVIRRIRSAGSSIVGRYALEQLINKGELVRVNRMVAIASEETILTKKQRARMEEILALFQGSRTPPTVKELAQQLQTSADAVSSLIRFATQQRVLVDLGNGFFIAQDAWMVMLGELQKMFEVSPELSVAQIRDGWKVTRKYAIPMLEYCDRSDLTTRQQDMRVPGGSLAQVLEREAVVLPGDYQNDGKGAEN